MKFRGRGAPAAVCGALLCISATATGEQSVQITLSGEQLRAAGIAVAHPFAAKAPQRIEALGLVLDATTLISDVGDSTVAAAAEQSASAELARLHALYEGGAGASRKMLEAAQADQARARAQA